MKIERVLLNSKRPGRKPWSFIHLINILPIHCFIVNMILMVLASQMECVVFCVSQYLLKLLSRFPTTFAFQCQFSEEKEVKCVQRILKGFLILEENVIKVFVSTYLSFLFQRSLFSFRLSNIQLQSKSGEFATRQALSELNLTLTNLPLCENVFAWPSYASTVRDAFIYVLAEFVR